MQSRTRNKASAWEQLNAETFSRVVSSVYMLLHYCGYVKIKLWIFSQKLIQIWIINFGYYLNPYIFAVLHAQIGCLLPLITHNLFTFCCLHHFQEIWRSISTIIKLIMIAYFILWIYWLLLLLFKLIWKGKIEIIDAPNSKFMTTKRCAGQLLYEIRNVNEYYEEISVQNAEVAILWKYLRWPNPSVQIEP